MAVLCPRRCLKSRRLGSSLGFQHPALAGASRTIQEVLVTKRKSDQSIWTDAEIRNICELQGTESYPPTSYLSAIFDPAEIKKKRIQDLNAYLLMSLNSLSRDTSIVFVEQFFQDIQFRPTEEAVRKFVENLIPTPVAGPAL